MPTDSVSVAKKHQKMRNNAISKKLNSTMKYLNRTPPPMERVNFFIGMAQLKYLQGLAGNYSEHIRRAIDDYIDKQKNLNVSASQSKRKEEGING